MGVWCTLRADHGKGPVTPSAPRGYVTRLELARVLPHVPYTLAPHPSLGHAPLIRKHYLPGLPSRYKACMSTTFGPMPGPSTAPPKRSNGPTVGEVHLANLPKSPTGAPAEPCGGDHLATLRPPASTPTTESTVHRTPGSVKEYVGASPLSVPTVLAAGHRHVMPTGKTALRSPEIVRMGPGPPASGHSVKLLGKIRPVLTI